MFLFRQGDIGYQLQLLQLLDIISFFSLSVLTSFSSERCTYYNSRFIFNNKSKTSFSYAIIEISGLVDSLVRSLVGKFINIVDDIIRVYILPSI